MNEEVKNLDIASALVAEVEKKAKVAQKKEEVQAKELLIRERRADNEIEKLVERDKNTEIAKHTSYGTTSEAEIEAIQKENTEYILAARSKMTFINEDFAKIIPYFRKNLILIGSETGYGKSTAVANIAKRAIRSIDKVSGKRKRTLIITNEERPEDVFNRITCLLNKWHYTEHDKFTDEQIEAFNKNIKYFARSGYITVIHDSFGGAAGTTTTLEGICQIFDNLIENKEYYDVVIIDYFQKIQESRKNPGMNEWQVQAALANRLDGYKNVYPAPIIVFAQLKPAGGEDENVPFKNRIEGRKTILNAATCCIELIPNREDLTTQWHIHKNRFRGESVGTHITTGYHYGNFVPPSNPDFQEMVSRTKANKDEAVLEEAIKEGDRKVKGLSTVTEKKDG